MHRAALWNLNVLQIRLAARPSTEHGGATGDDDEALKRYAS